MNLSNVNIGIKRTSTVAGFMDSSFQQQKRIKLSAKITQDLNDHSLA